MLYYERIRIEKDIFLFDFVYILSTSENDLIRIIWGDDDCVLKSFGNIDETKHLTDSISGYFQGQAKIIDYKVDFNNPSFVELNRPTEWQITVWQNAMDIPYARTVTYGELARQCGNPKAARAVGTALGKNPLPIVVPCHRVVGAGSIGGFTSLQGLAHKKALIDFEARNIQT